MNISNDCRLLFYFSFVLLFQRVPVKQVYLAGPDFVQIIFIKLFKKVQESMEEIIAPCYDISADA